MANGKGLIDELVNYLKKNLKKGYTEESLRWALINQGYSRLEVERSIRRVNEKLASEAPILKTKPEIEHKFVDSKDLSIKKRRRWF